MSRRTLKFGRGTAMIEMPNVYADILERALSQGANKRLVDMVEKACAELRDDAYSKWPESRKKGRRKHRSRDALKHAVRYVPPDTIEGVVYVDPGSDAADYAYFIRSAKVRSHRGHAVTALLHAPGRRRAKQLAKELAQILADEAGKVK